MAKPNYAFVKRQRDAARKQKQEEKRLKKAAARGQTIDRNAARDAETAADRGADEPAAGQSGPERQT